MTIEQDSYDSCTSGTISSGGLGPCAGIGIYDPIKKIGYMLHYSDIKMGDNLNTILDEISPLFADLKRVEIYVSGISKSKGDSKDIQLMRSATKKYIKQVLKERFDKRQFTISYGLLDGTTDMHLDIETGKFEIQKFTRDEALD